MLCCKTSFNFFRQSGPFFGLREGLFAPVSRLGTLFESIMAPENLDDFRVTPLKREVWSASLRVQLH